MGSGVTNSTLNQKRSHVLYLTVNVRHSRHLCERAIALFDFDADWLEHEMGWRATTSSKERLRPTVDQLHDELTA